MEVTNFYFVFAKRGLLGQINKVINSKSSVFATKSKNYT